VSGVGDAIDRCDLSFARSVADAVPPVGRQPLSTALCRPTRRRGRDGVRSVDSRIRRPLRRGGELPQGGGGL